MLDATVSGLIILAVSGLSFMAYKHPGAYHRVHYWLMAIPPAVLFGCLLWNMAVSETYYALREFIQGEKALEALAARVKRQFDLDWVLAGSLAAAVYLTVLHSLPAWIARSERRD
jgi:hypothetical protein